MDKNAAVIANARHEGGQYMEEGGGGTDHERGQGRRPTWFRCFCAFAYYCGGIFSMTPGITYGPTVSTRTHVSRIVMSHFRSSSGRRLQLSVHVFTSLEYLLLYSCCPDMVCVTSVLTTVVLSWFRFTLSLIASRACFFSGVYI